MKIKAKFIGTSSLGYESNKIYNLELKEYKSMSVQRENGEGYCEYESLSAFLRNWNLISRL